MKNSLITVSFLILLIGVSFVSAITDTAENAEKEITYDLEKSEDLTGFYTRGRFLLGFLSLFKGGNCGDGVCDRYEFSCFEDCGRIVAKNGLFGGEIYSGESSYNGIKYQFQIDGICEGVGSTLKEKDTKGAILKNINVVVNYGEEETFIVQDKEDFVLKNGETFYINSQMCELLGFVDVGISDPVCGDGICWGSPKEIRCLQDCEFFWVGFQQKDELTTPIKTNFVYENYDYTFEVTYADKVIIPLQDEQGYILDPITKERIALIEDPNYIYPYPKDMKIDLSVTYFPIENPSSKITKNISLVGGGHTGPVETTINGIDFKVFLPLGGFGPKLSENTYVLSFSLNKEPGLRYR